MPNDQADIPAGPRSRIRELCWTFLKLGVIGFGGPAAHIALMRQELVVRKRWLSDHDLVDLLGAANLIPGPNSTEVAIHIGNVRAGWKGLLTAGICFILPAAVIVAWIASLYVQYGRLPEFEGILRGIKPVVIVIILQALWGLGRAALRRPVMIAAAGAAAVLNILGIHELVLLFGAGAALALGRLVKRPPKTLLCGALPLPGLLLAAAKALASVSLGGLFLTFLKIGSVLFGSGYVLLAFLRADFIERSGWLTEAQLLDAVAVGQATPGPLFTTATFIGYLLGRLPGAVVSTAGIFLPAFIFVALSGLLITRIRRSPVAGAFLDGVNAASLALMAVVTGQLARSAVVDVPSAAIALAAAAALLWLRLNVTWLVAGGAAAGLLLASPHWIR
ncbi:MAG: chromate efflux transporter [Rhodospirillales bacterium]